MRGHDPTQPSVAAVHRALGIVGVAAGPCADCALERGVRGMPVTVGFCEVNVGVQGSRRVRKALPTYLDLRSLMNPFRSAIIASVLFPISLFVITAALV